MIQVAGCKLPFISEIYNCIYSKKIVNKVSIIIIDIEQSDTLCTCLKFYRNFLFESSVLDICLCIITFEIMFRSSIRGMFLLFVVCLFCDKDFKSLGRHSWRCKQRVHQVNAAAATNASSVCQPSLINSPETIIAKRSALKCCCGKN